MSTTNVTNVVTDFERTAIKAEKLAEQNLSVYKFKLLTFALLGYLVIFLVLLALLGIVGGLIGMAFLSTALFLLLVKKKLILVLLPTVWILLKSLWIRFEAPSGYLLKQKDCPNLFAEINRLRKRLKAPKIHQVILTPELNAAITQTPRLGILGWQKNTLTLGLELLLTLSPEQAQAVVAHELGHLSGNHSRFNGWIYRIRLTWYRIMDAFDHTNSFGGRLMGKFFNWYAPRFSAYSFALARANEYEADAIAAEITSSETAGQALISAHVTGPYVDENYWNVYFKKADELPQPEHPPWTGLNRFLIDHDSASQRLTERLNEELKRETSFEDTHPSLQDRIQALRSTTQLSEPVKHSAAKIWFGDQFQKIIGDFDREWMSTNGERWKKRHSYVVESKNKLTELKGKQLSDLDDDQLWQFATLTEKFSEQTEALTLYRAYQTRHPENPNAAFVIGRIFYEQEHEAFLDEMKKALANPQLVVDACRYAYHYLNEKNREAEAKWWREQAEDKIRIDQESDQERATLDPKDTIKKADISQELRAYIIEKLKENKRIKKAWLAEKAVVHYPDVPALAIALSFNGFFRSYDSEVARITNHLNLNCTHYVVPKSGDYRQLAKSIIKHGERII